MWAAWRPAWQQPLAESFTERGRGETVGNRERAPAGLGRLAATVAGLGRAGRLRIAAGKSNA